MKKYLLLIPVVLLFIAWQTKPVTKATPQTEDKALLLLLRALFEPKGNTVGIYQGRAVDSLDARYCILEYDQKMPASHYPRTRTASGTVTREPIEVRQITQSVNFTGLGLSAWMNKKISEAGGLENIDFRIVFGIYTSNYVTKYHLDPSFKGRISVFLKPYTPSNKKDKNKRWDPIGDDVYNLGGLKP